MKKKLLFAAIFLRKNRGGIIDSAAAAVWHRFEGGFESYSPSYEVLLRTR